MQVVASPPFRTGSIAWQEAPGQWTLTVVCKATYALAPVTSPFAAEPEDVNERDNHWDDDPQKSLYLPSDLAPMKPEPEVVLVGSAFAPRAQPVRSLHARIIVGQLDKSIEVFCPRTWLPDGTLRDGPLWTQMPLRYERAAGGEGTWNPVGIPADTVDRYGRRPLPNLQPPGVVMSQPGDVITTTGFGPIAPSWPGRHDHLHDRALLNRWDKEPLGEGFDAAFFQTSPRDQRVAELRPDEQIILENLHLEHPRLVTKLPGVRPRARVEAPEMPAWDLLLVADTLWIDTLRAICTLVWRGQVPIDDRDQPGIVRIGAEEPGREVRWPSSDAPPPRTRHERPSQDFGPTMTDDVTIRAELGNEVKPVLPFQKAGAGAGAGTTAGAPRPAPKTLVSAPPKPLVAPKQKLPELWVEDDHTETRSDVGAALLGATPTWLQRGAPPRAPSAPPPMPGPPAMAPPMPGPMSAPMPGPMSAPMPGPMSAPMPAGPMSVGSMSTSMPGPMSAPMPAGAMSAPMAPPPSIASPAIAPPPMVPPSIAGPAIAPPPPSLSAPSMPAPLGAAPLGVPSPLGTMSRPLDTFGGGPAISSAKPPPPPSVGTLRPDDRTLAGATYAGVLEASNAAADPRPSTPRRALPSEPPAPMARTLVELIWHDPAKVARVRQIQAWQPLLRAPAAPPPPPPPAAGAAPPAEDPEAAARAAEAKARGERADVAAVLARATPVVDVEGAIMDAASEDGDIEPPLVVVAGELELGLDEVKMLEAMLGAAGSFAQGDKKLKEVIDLASEVMRTPLGASPGVAASFVARLREAWVKSTRLLPADYLDVHTRRLLLEQRSYQKRELWGDAYIRAVLAPSGEGSGIPTYLPAPLAKQLPLFARFPARVIAEAFPQQDQLETHPVALRVTALARVVAGRARHR